MQLPRSTDIVLLHTISCAQDPREHSGELYQAARRRAARSHYVELAIFVASAPALSVPDCVFERRAYFLLLKTRHQIEVE